MGFYHGSVQQPEPEKEPGGCMEVLIISRAIFGVLLIPLAVVLGVLAAIIVLVALFSVHWALGLLGLATAAVGIAWYARWERRKFRPGDR